MSGDGRTAYSGAGPVTVNLVAVDDCGDWPTFVGSGPTALPPASAPAAPARAPASAPTAAPMQPSTPPPTRTPTPAPSRP